MTNMPFEAVKVPSDLVGVDVGVVLYQEGPVPTTEEPVFTGERYLDQNGFDRISEYIGDVGNLAKVSKRHLDDDPDSIRNTAIALGRHEVLGAGEDIIKAAEFAVKVLEERREFIGALRQVNVAYKRSEWEQYYLDKTARFAISEQILRERTEKLTAVHTDGSEAQARGQEQERNQAEREKLLQPFGGLIALENDLVPVVPKLHGYEARRAELLAQKESQQQFIRQQSRGFSQLRNFLVDYKGTIAGDMADSGVERGKAIIAECEAKIAALNDEIQNLDVEYAEPLRTERDIRIQIHAIVSGLNPGTRGLSSGELSKIINGIKQDIDNDRTVVLPENAVAENYLKAFVYVMEETEERVSLKTLSSYSAMAQRVIADRVKDLTMRTGKSVQKMEEGSRESTEQYVEGVVDSVGQFVREIQETDQRYQVAQDRLQGSFEEIDEALDAADGEIAAYINVLTGGKNTLSVQMMWAASNRGLVDRIAAASKEIEGLSKKYSKKGHDMLHQEIALYDRKDEAAIAQLNGEESSESLEAVADGEKPDPFKVLREKLVKEVDEVWLRADRSLSLEFAREMSDVHAGMDQYTAEAEGVQFAIETEVRRMGGALVRNIEASSYAGVDAARKVYGHFTNILPESERRLREQETATARHAIEEEPEVIHRRPAGGFLGRVAMQINLGTWGVDGKRLQK